METLELHGAIEPKITLTGTIQAEVQLTGRLTLQGDGEVIPYATEQDIIHIFKGGNNHE